MKVFIEFLIDRDYQKIVTSVHPFLNEATSIPWPQSLEETKEAIDEIVKTIVWDLKNPSSRFLELLENIINIQHNLSLTGYKPNTSEHIQQVAEFLNHNRDNKYLKSLLRKAKMLSEATSPPCPNCGSKMVLRTARQGYNIGQQFWGCSNYPRCKGTLGYNPQQQQQLPQQAKYVGDEIPARAFTPPQKRMVTQWIWAKAIADAPNLGLKNGDNLAVSQLDKENWKFVSIDLDNRLGNMGTIPAANIKNIIQRQLDINQNIVAEESPSKLLKKLMPQDKSTGELAAHKLTEEGKNIEARFEKMITGEGPSHMVINALAGSGKTTMLKHLAYKYGKPGQSWLYLVFNKRNEREASKSFPKFVTVKTTNSYAGSVLDNNNIKPTERIVRHSFAEKAQIIVDGPQFNEFLNTLNIPDPNQIPSDFAGDRKLPGLLKGIRFEFNSEAIKLLGLAKSFAIDPRNKEQLKDSLENVVSQYDINSDLERIKERIEKLPQADYYNEAISQIMGVDNFLKTDFKEELKQATIWLLEKTLPHGIDQEFEGSKGQSKGQKFNLKGMRDFNDDLWFAATHADEINWTKPKRWDIVLADEVQDFNAAQQKVLQKLSETGAKIVAVGDPSQSIYRFRGADSKAFDNLTSSLQQWSSDKDGVEQTLTKNFRSKKEILDFVNERTIMNNKEKGLQAGKAFNVEGNVTDGELTYDEAFSTLKSEFDHMGEVKQTAFISRTNEPLAHAALKLLSEGIPFVIVGKDLAKELMQHVDRVSRISNVWDDNPLSELLDALNSYIEDKKTSWFGKVAKSGPLKQLEETTKALTASIEHVMEDENGEEMTVKDFKQWLKARLGGVDPDTMSAQELAKFEKELEDKNPIVLTTAHRSKGLEFDRVYILRDDQFPHPKAKRDEDLEQEENARYVAYTRAMGELHILDLDGQPGADSKDQKKAA